MTRGIHNNTQKGRRAVLFLLLMFCIPAVSLSQSARKENLFWKVVNFVDRQLQQDTLYVAPNRYNLTVMPQYTHGYDYYRFSTKDKSQSITIAPSSNNKIGLHFGWRWLFFGYSFALNKSQPEFDMDLNLYCSRLGLELFYRKRSDGFKIRNLQGFIENDLPLVNYKRDFDGLSTSQMGANLFYVFNYKKFSFPAAFSQSTNQRRNAGSLILGLSYNEQKFDFDHTRIDPAIEKLMKSELQFKCVDYRDISINLGYSYNWVFAKNFLANISVSPAISYKNTSLKLNISNSKEFVSSINFDLISRLALVYNNGRYFAGASLVSHTYSYTQPSLSVQNGFGYLKIYAGFNFLRRK